VVTSHFGNLLAPGLAAFLLAVASLPLVRSLAAHYGVVSSVYGEASPRGGTPLLGGISIISSILIPLWIVGAMPTWIGGPTIGLLIVGVLDDVVVMRPSQKFSLQLIAVAIVVFAAPQFALTAWRLASVMLAGFFLLSTVNAFNLIDGLDGLAGGIGIAAALAAAGVAALCGDGQAVMQALAIAGALAGFLVYNFHPASIFMGDGGALPLGLLLGILALHVGGLSDPKLAHYGVPILIMLVPLLDTTVVTISRIITGTPVSRRGLDHSHHRLLALGLSHRRAVVGCWGLGLAAGACAVTIALMPYTYLVATLPLMIVAFGLVGLFMVDLTFDSNSPSMVCSYLHGMGRLIVVWTYKRRIAEVLFDLVVFPAAYFGAFLLRLDFRIDQGRIDAILATLPWVMMATYAAFAVTGVYRGIWRYAAFSDIVRFANGAILAGVFVVAISLVRPLELSGSIAVLYVILVFNLLLASRFSFRAIRRAIALIVEPANRVLIVGAGLTAESAARYLASALEPLRVIGFVDDDNFKFGKFFHGRPILGSIADLEEIFARNRFNQILVAADNLPTDQIAEVWKMATLHQIAVRRFSIDLSEMAAAPVGSQPLLAITPLTGTGGQSVAYN
jgi:UDP-GlcNAc:undecaprenyl-phosphate/decaprenyl-phosphate GlcNAc-1-phosphate transferase